MFRWDSNLTHMSCGAVCLRMFAAVPFTAVGKLYTVNGKIWDKYGACAREIRRDFNNTWDRRVEGS